jgi:Arc/MetJ-type ribon-helix-helix transcriptional regulator
MSKNNRFSVSLTVALPTKLSDLVVKAAEQRYTNTSSYVRQSIARSLKDDGFDLDARVA